MIFIIIGTVSFLIWWVLGQHKLLSVSFANFAGFLIFVALGLYYNPYPNTLLTIIIGIGFYLFLALGELAARFLPFNGNRYKRLGERLKKDRFLSMALVGWFIIFSLFPILQIISSGQSIGAAWAAIWGSNIGQEMSQQLIERANRSAMGLEALLSGIQSQLLGFWYLGLGIVVARKRSYFYPLLAVYLLGLILTSGGSRYLIMTALMLPILIFFSLGKTPRLRTLILVGLLGVGSFLALDYLRNGRQGEITQGNLQVRIERTLKIDFAFGGLGLNLGLNNLPNSMDRGVSYLGRIAVLPIPRILWPGKPTSNPNQEFTETATGRNLADYGSILLFTPLGEALYYLGYFGIILIPFLYGFLVVFLERLYSTSIVYKGLSIQVYIWAFVSMRTTFFNLFSILIAQNFILLCVLVILAHLILVGRKKSRHVAQTNLDLLKR